MTVYQDLRYGLRLLARSPAFTLVAVTTLALGIAANTAVFGWIDSVLLRPLPGTAAGDRLVVFELIDPSREGFNISYPDFRDNLTLSSVAVSRFPNVLELGEGEHTQRVWGEFVSGNYFNVMGVEPLMGRFFLPEEQGDAPPASRVAVVSERLWRTHLGADPDVVAPADGVGDERVVIANESFARRFFGTQNPIGRRVGGRGGEWYTVVGLVHDSKANSLAEGPRPYLYVPLRRDAVPTEIAVFVRTRGDAATSAATLRRDAATLDPQVGALDVMPLREYIDAPLFAGRIAATLLTVLGAVALLLAAVGLYGLMAHAVGERTQEIGIRMAMGARPADVLGMVVRRGMRLTATGLLIGALVALAAARLVSSLLVDTSASGPVVFAGAASFLGLVALAASGLPALRASRLDPAVALRRT